MNPTESFHHLLQTRGVSLGSFGVREIALGREDALSALDLLRGASVPVLGGDVYFRRGAALELAYADWHCERNEREPSDDYLRRSLRAAEDYIKRFPERQGVTPLFALVPGDPPRSSG